MTYWALNAVFLGAVAVLVAVGLLRRRSPRWPALALTLAVVLVMTAVFDNVMIGVGLVDYNPAYISGAFIGIAPLEDFAYAVAAAVGLPALWALLGPGPSTGSGTEGAGTESAGSAPSTGSGTEGAAVAPSTGSGTDGSGTESAGSPHA